MNTNRSDIARVLQALTGREERPGDTAHTLLDAEGRHTLNKDPIEVRAQRLPPLLIPAQAPIFTGGGAVVVQCVNRDQPAIRYALKVTRPSLLAKRDSKAAYEQKAAQLEFYQHAPLIHRNIARVFGIGEVSVKTPPRDMGVTARVIQIEWIDDAKPFRAYLAETPLTWTDVLDLLHQSLAALAYLHQKGLIHWDVKSENLLVGSDRVARLTDIGNARPADGSDAQKAFSTFWNLPKALLPRRRRREGESFRRVGIRVPAPEWDSPYLDLWMFGLDLNRIFDADRDALSLDSARGNPDAAMYSKQRHSFLTRVMGHEDSEYTLAYVQLLVRRLLWPTSPREDCYYSSASEVAHDLRKLDRTFGDAFRVAELETNPQHVVRIPIAGNVAFTPRIAALLNSRMVSRLTKHGQLAAVPLVYPGATHRRSEHSVGVYATTIAYVRALYADRSNPFWRATISARDIEALLLAAFVHDIGHISFGHLLEEMTGLIGDNVHEEYALAALSEGGPAVPKELVEDRGEVEALVRRDWATGGDSDVRQFLELVRMILKPPSSPAVTPDGVEIAIVRRTSHIAKFRLLHSIISSAIDADKLDYLERDAHHCNVEYPKGIDLERFFQALTTVVTVGTSGERPTFTACVGVSDKGIAPLESILIARYHMFATVYWQHTVRTLTSMLQYAVQEYVASEPDDCDKRLHEVITQFRTLSDREALVWLRQSLSGRKRLTEQVRRRLVGICNALLSEGPRTYRTAFELRYESASASGRRVVEAFTDVWDGLHASSNPYEYVNKWRVFRRNISQLLAGRLRLPVTTFKPSDILIDIPPAGKDQIEDVFVVARGEARRVQEVSPMADAVGKAFQYWVRKPRIFIARETYVDLVKVGLDSRLQSAAWHVLEKVSRQEDPQQTLLDLDPLMSDLPEDKSRVADKRKD